MPAPLPIRPFNLAFPDEPFPSGGNGGSFGHPSGTAYDPGGFGSVVGAFTPSAGPGGLPGGADFGSGLPGAIGSGINAPGGWDIGIPGFLGNSGGSSTPTAPVTPASDSIGSKVAGAVGNAVLSALGIKRLAIFLLGLICVIGAIYLYKPTQDIVAGPIGAVKDAAKGAGAAIAAG